MYKYYHKLGSESKKSRGRCIIFRISKELGQVFLGAVCHKKAGPSLALPSFLSSRYRQKYSGWLDYSMRVKLVPSFQELLSLDIQLLMYHL
ncbi:MAG: hypothetical protein DRH26_19080, partial [Deltaproteobacteria bacterium]